LSTVCVVALAGAAAWAGPIPAPAPAPSPISATGPSILDSPRFQKWFDLYKETNGDHSVVLRLEPTRFLLTEQTSMTGFVELDLIDGKVLIELYDLDREVDVWALDNANRTGILPGDKGDRLVLLARLSPGEDGTVRFEEEVGPEAFRGFELDWVFVSDAGTEPDESRLRFSSRDYLERLFTKRRLAAEGFDVSIGKLGPQGDFSHEGGVDKAGFGIATRPHPILVMLGLVTQEQFDGAGVFFRETFEGNGRSCGTCHPAENNQTIDGPDFIDGLPDSDPLFVAEQRPPTDPISQLEVPILMRKHKLIVENVDGLDDPTVKFVMRGVPHSLSLATSTNPDDGLRTGWSGDGAPPPGTIRNFLLGATIQHYPNKTLDRIPGIDFRLPTDDELDDNVAFMLSVGRLDDVNLGGVSLNNLAADAGRAAFIGSGCNFCHVNAGATTAGTPGVNSNFLTNVELLFNPATVTEPMPLDAAVYPFDAGFGTAPANCDPTSPGPDGFGDCTFNTTPLIEAADTAPLFHNNTAETIEDAVAFYSGPPFPGPFIFPGDPVTQRNVAAFLRMMNATFNLQIAIQRTEVALLLTPQPVPTTSRGVPQTVNKLLALSSDELEDTLRVLNDGPLGKLVPSANGAIEKTLELNKLALNNTNMAKRRELITEALEKLNFANNALGSGTGFTMGAGNLHF
jgi:hypothetical protein